MIQYAQELWALALNGQAEGQAQGVWFWAALYALLVCAYSALYQHRVRRWPSTQGDLIEARVGIFGGFALAGSIREYIARTQYRYQVGAQEFNGTRLSPWLVVGSVKRLLKKQLARIKHTNDGSVVVYYDPRNPQKSYLIVPGTTSIALTALVGALPALGFWIKYHGTL